MYISTEKKSFNQGEKYTTDLERDITLWMNGRGAWWTDYGIFAHESSVDKGSSWEKDKVREWEGEKGEGGGKMKKVNEQEKIWVRKRKRESKLKKWKLEQRLNERDKVSENERITKTKLVSENETGNWEQTQKRQEEIHMRNEMWKCSKLINLITRSESAFA